MITAEQAKQIAIVYNALHEATNADRVEDKAIWAERLLDLQKETGVEMHPAFILKHLVEVAYAD